MRFNLVFLAILCVLSVNWTAKATEDYAQQREQMVAREIEAAGVSHPTVLKSMRATPRHEFVPRGFLKQAYFDAALPIGDRQTISPPFVVAYMTQELDPKPTDRVLEIGTGSGYQAAVLSPLVSDVYTIEIVERLGKRAQRTLQRLDYKNVHVRIGDGYQGWAEHAPFDKIIVTCSPEKIPQPLVDQLKEGGQIIVPVGQRYQQNLYRLTKKDNTLVRETLRATLFVPMTGSAEDIRQVLPDPLKPTIVNGDFEKVIGDKQLPDGWHYLRNARVEGGQSYLSFANAQAGQPSRALQGLAIDGRSIRKIKLSASVCGQDIGKGLTPLQTAAIIITFYDKRRSVISSANLSGWKGSFAWQTAVKGIHVPLATREAIVRLGMHGGTGQFDIDDVALIVVSTEDRAGDKEKAEN